MAETKEQLKERKTREKRVWRKNNPQRAREIRNRWAKNNPEKAKTIHKKWIDRNKEYIKEYMKEWRTKAVNSGKWRKYDLKKYDLTPEEYDRILESQKCMCAICGIDESKLKRRLFVDHDHATGKVRGLLCSNCNFVLGYAKDSKATLRNAIDYLIRHA